MSREEALTLVGPVFQGDRGLPRPSRSIFSMAGSLKLQGCLWLSNPSSHDLPSRRSQDREIEVQGAGASVSSRDVLSVVSCFSLFTFSFNIWCGVGFASPPCGFQGSNSGRQAGGKYLHPLSHLVSPCFSCFAFLKSIHPLNPASTGDLMWTRMGPPRLQSSVCSTVLPFPRPGRRDENQGGGMPPPRPSLRDTEGS